MKRVTAGVAAIGVLTFGLASVAGASTTPSPSTHQGRALLTISDAQLQKRLANFDCSRADRVLRRIGRVDARISAGLPGLTKAEHTAQANGNSARAARIQHRIDSVESPAFKRRLATVQSSIEQKCHVQAPATTGV